jgi:crotonobetainyl-CoA:carnitine CoA-transferase CaiB-like acyl-CoA transferase
MTQRTTGDPSDEVADDGGAAGPLAGVRVVEMGVWVAGPGAAGILADWGADVVKIEPPGGDPARTFQRLIGGDVNAVFELDNRGKRSIALDLVNDAGVEAARRLIAGADVFVTNVRPSALERHGLGPETVRADHPGLVYAIITGFGLDGPDADRGAYDIAAFWARAGIAESLRQPGGPLPFQRGGMGDHSASMTGAAMISAALVRRARTGTGQVVSTSLLRQGAYTIGFDVNVTLMLGRTIAVGVREQMYSPTVNNYTAGDGRPFWIVGLEGDRHWPALARAVGRPEWLEDERFESGMARAVNATALIAELDAVFATRPLDEWADAFGAEPDVFWSPVNSIEDLIADPQFHAAGGVVGVPDEDGGRAMLATPADFDGAAPSPRWRAPRLGEHTREVLAEAGYDDEAIAALVRAGAAVPPDAAAT